MSSSSPSSKSLLLEIPLQICLLGAGNTGKTILREQLLQNEALSKIFDKTIFGEDDDTAHLVSPNLRHDEKKELYPPHRTFPAVDSLGTNHSSSEFTMDLFGDGRVKIILVFEIFEIGGASCCGNYQDKELIEMNCSRADLILAVYNLCDRTSLLNLMNDILPIICSLENTKDDQQQQQQSPPIFITGTKRDARKSLSAEERKNAVVAPDQKELESKFQSYLEKSVKKNPKTAPDGIILDSVAAGGDGTGLMRLRREIFLEIFRRKKHLFDKLPIPVPAPATTSSNKNGKNKKDEKDLMNASTNSSLWDELSSRQMDTLDKNVGKTFTVGKVIRNKSAVGGGNNYRFDHQPGAQKNNNNNLNDGGGGFSPANICQDDREEAEDGPRSSTAAATGKLEAPVLDPKSAKKNAKDEKKEKGANCGAMCGCASQ